MNRRRNRKSAADQTGLFTDLDPDGAPKGSIEDRIERLRDFTTQGEGYVRGVADPVSDARRLHAQGRDDEAAYWLNQAEDYARAQVGPGWDTKEEAMAAASAQWPGVEPITDGNGDILYWFDPDNRGWVARISYRALTGKWHNSHYKRLTGSRTASPVMVETPSHLHKNLTDKGWETEGEEIDRGTPGGRRYIKMHPHDEDAPPLGSTSVRTATASPTELLAQFEGALPDATDDDLLKIWDDASKMQASTTDHAVQDVIAQFRGAIMVEMIDRGLESAASKTAYAASDFEGGGLIFSLWMAFKEWFFTHASGYSDYADEHAFASLKPKAAVENPKVCARCGAPATAYVMDSSPNGWGESVCEACKPAAIACYPSAIVYENQGTTASKTAASTCPACGSEAVEYQPYPSAQSVCNDCGWSGQAPSEGVSWDCANEWHSRCSGCGCAHHTTATKTASGQFPVIPDGMVVVKVTSHRSRERMMSALGVDVPHYEPNVERVYPENYPPNYGRWSGDGDFFLIPASKVYDVTRIPGITLVRDPSKHTDAHGYMNTPAPKFMSTGGRIALNEMTAPPEVDTLRDEACPVCGEQDAYTGDECSVCGYKAPPDFATDPDTSKARAEDLRKDLREQNGVPSGLDEGAAVGLEKFRVDGPQGAPGATGEGLEQFRVAGLDLEPGYATWPEPAGPTAKEIAFAAWWEDRPEIEGEDTAWEAYEEYLDDEESIAGDMAFDEMRDRALEDA